MRPGIFGSTMGGSLGIPVRLLGQGNVGDCPEGQITILGQCAAAAIACLNDDGTYRVFEIEEWNGRTGINVPTGVILAENATQDDFREMGIERVVFLDAEESECSGGPSDEHSACLRFTGLYDLIDPDTGEVLDTGVIEADLPPNTARLHDTGNQCYPCPAGLTPHEDGYGCCEPAEHAQNENGECVQTRVCHHPGPSYDYAETVPDEFAGAPWEETFGPDYEPPPPDIIEDVVDGEACGLPGGGSADIGADGPSTLLVAGGAVGVLAAVGLALWG